jgi:hypothetical protein
MVFAASTLMRELRHGSLKQEDPSVRNQTGPCPALRPLNSKSKTCAEPNQPAQTVLFPAIPAFRVPEP